MTDQRGMTLTELVMAVAVTGIIIAFFGTAMYQLLTVTAYGSSRLVAAHELENASFWFNHDGQEAVSASGGSSLSLMLSDNSSVTYATTGRELRRSASGDYIIVARNITDIDFSVSGRLITMDVTSAPEGRDEVVQNGSYRVMMRAAEAAP